MKGLHIVTWILLIVGGLNWLALGLFGWEIGEIFGGSSAMLSRVIYILVGASAVYEIFNHKRTCKYCGKSGGGMESAAPTSQM